MGGVFYSVLLAFVVIVAVVVFLFFFDVWLCFGSKSRTCREKRDQSLKNIGSAIKNKRSERRIDRGKDNRRGGWLGRTKPPPH